MVLNWISSPEQEAASFCSHFNNSPPRQIADRQSKSKHSEILLKSMLFQPEPRSYECHFKSLESSTLCYALMNYIVPYNNQVLPLLEQLTPWTRQSKTVTVSSFFHPSRHVFNPITPTHGHFVLSPVSLASRDQDSSLSDSTIHISGLTEK